ncbi:DUF1361 domain-containing protein [Paenibacillus sp. FJAT-26967]|uniref:DUF1361 domain-containing protein n=1 Tax=Paenibacillus sp. FJAT-26967 TaxID=1729690 RepID=UPI000837D308|nr:DUF1361 domain-containing protein [Paenibacillus sp. FJAT-26967]
MNRSSRKETYQVILLLSATLLCLGLAAYLRFVTNTNVYNYLAWDFFLAWVPVILSGMIKFMNRRLAAAFSSKLATGVVFIAWVFFLPNSAYLFTEILHTFRYFDPQPPSIKFWFDPVFWYSLSVTFTAAVTGLLLSALSLYQVHGLIVRFVARVYSGAAIVCIVLLSSIGVYIGRFIRWNSWDVLNKPLAIMKDLLAESTRTDSLMPEFVLLMFGIQLFSYVFYCVLRTGESASA